MTRVHITTGKHWSISIADCPECSATKGHNCIRQHRDAKRKLNFERYSKHIVHAARILESGFDVKGNAPKPKHLDKIPKDAVIQL
jgi:hypothetical protein